MKTFFVLTNRTEEEYLNNYSEFFKLDNARCDEYEKTKESYFKSDSKEDKEIFQIIHVFNDDDSLESFIYQQFKSLPEYSAIIENGGKRLLKKDIVGHRMYLPLIKSRIFFQVSESLHKIKDNEEWEDCNQIIKRVPIYAVCEMGQSKNPLVLIAIVR